MRAPVVLRRIDRDSGRAEVLDIPCGARTAAKCRPCAERNRRLRQRQIGDGWQRAEGPVLPVEPPSTEVVALLRLRAEYLFERDPLHREEQWPQVR